MKTIKGIKPSADFFGNSGENLLYRTKYRLFEKVTFIFVIIMTGLFPLFFGDGGYGNITVTKFIGFASLTIIYSVVIGFIFVEVYLIDKKIGKARLAQIPSSFRLPQILCCVLVLLAVLSMLFSKQPDMWLGQSRYEGLFAILLYSAVFLGVSCWGEYSEKYIYVYGVMVSIFCIISLIQIGGGSFITLTDFWKNHFLGTMGNVDVVSGFSAVSVPLLGAAFIILGGKAKYLLCLPQAAVLFFIQLFVNVDSGKIGFAAAFVFITILACTEMKRIGRYFILLSAFSLSAAVNKLLTIYGSGEETAPSISVHFGNTVLILAAASLFFALLGFLILKSKKELPLSPKRIRLILLAVFAVIIILGLIFLYNYSGSAKLLSEISGILHGEFSDLAGSNRGFVWKKTVLLIGENPLLGTGPGTYLSAFQKYSELFQQQYSSTIFFDFAHNDFLQIAAERGLLSLGVYLAMLAVIAFRAIKVVDKNPLVIIFGASVIGYLGHVFFGFSIAILTPIFWVMLGLLDKTTKQTPPEKEK